MPTAYEPARRAASKPCSARTARKNVVRDLGEDAGAVAGVGLGARGAAVLEVLQRGERPCARRRATCSPDICATKATPQASFSCSGWYRPWGAGMADRMVTPGGSPWTGSRTGSGIR